MDCNKDVNIVTQKLFDPNNRIRFFNKERSFLAVKSELELGIKRVGAQELEAAHIHVVVSALKDECQFFAVI